MDTTTKPDGPTPMETLIGCIHAEVRFANGEMHKVDVLMLPIRLFPRLLELQSDEEALVELYTGKEPGWAATLTRDAAMDILEAGDRINADFFARWVKRRMDVQKRLALAADPPTIEAKTLRSGSPKSALPVA